MSYDSEPKKRFGVISLEQAKDEIRDQYAREYPPTFSEQQIECMRSVTRAENLHILAAGLCDQQLSPVEKRELEKAASMLETQVPRNKK
jgi:hypothetical protein